jgi:hypothetical protein
MDTPTIIAIIVLAIVGTGLLVVSTHAGRDALAGIFARMGTGVLVNHIVMSGAPSDDAIRSLRAYTVALEGQRQQSLLVLAESAVEAARPMIGAGEPIEVTCVPFFYRVIEAARESWLLVTVPGWLAWLAAPDCEHGGRGRHAPTILRPRPRSA